MLNKKLNLVNFSNQLISGFANCNIPPQLLKLALYIIIFEETKSMITS